MFVVAVQPFNKNSYMKKVTETAEDRETASLIDVLFGENNQRVVTVLNAYHISYFKSNCSELTSY